MPGLISPIGVGTVATIYARQSTAGSGVDTLATPGDTNPPIIFEPPSGLSGGDLELWMIATGGTDWGGCQVWVSSDGNTYAMAGTVYRGGRQGLLTAPLPSHADPDTTDALSVDLSREPRSIAVRHDGRCRQFRDAELLRWRVAELPDRDADRAPTHYDLTYLRRGVYGTPVNAHSAGSNFARLRPERPVAVPLPLPSQLCRQDDLCETAGLQHFRAGVAGFVGADRLTPTA